MDADTGDTEAREQKALILDSSKVWAASNGSSTGSSQAESVDINHFGLRKAENNVGAFVSFPDFCKRYFLFV